MFHWGAGSELVIGPWSHSGFLDNRVGHGVAGRRSKFNHLTHILAFFDRCCGRSSLPETVAALTNADASQESTNGTGAPLALSLISSSVQLGGSWIPGTAQHCLANPRHISGGSVSMAVPNAHHGILVWLTVIDVQVCCNSWYQVHGFDCV